MATKVLSDNLYQDICEVIKNWYGVDLTDDQITALVKDDRTLLTALHNDGAFDTLNREQLGDVLARYVLGPGRRWPNYGDGKIIWEKFIAEFERRAATLGIKIL